MKKTGLIILVLMFWFLAGCATYWAKGVMLNLNEADKSKLTTMKNEGMIITAYPLTTDKEAQKYFDEDLISDGVIAVFLEIQNISDNDVRIISVTMDLEEKNNNEVRVARLQSMTPQDVFGVMKRGSVGKAIFWMFPTYFVGAPISLLATYFTNSKIKDDLEQTKMLDFAKGEIKPSGMISGFVCFRIPETQKDRSTLKGELKIILKNDRKLIECNLKI